MGDFRFSFKATFRMGDVSDTCDMWLNWSPDEDTDIDQRVLEWLRDNFSKGATSIKDSLYAGAKEQEERDMETRERQEYERLKEKFG